MQISKSTYTNYINCPRMMWLNLFKNEEAKPLSLMQENIFKNGNKVGELAKTYFPNTKDCSRPDKNGSPILDEQIKATQDELDNKAECIAEASFRAGDLYCAVDLLKDDGDGGYSIYEVKSFKEIDKDHEYCLYDVSFQKYVVEKAGITVNHIYIMHINGDYEFDGTLKLDEYFKIECVDSNAIVLDNLKNIEDNLDKIRSIISGPDPITPYMSDCKDCAFHDHCIKVDEDSSIENLYGLRWYNFFNKGIYTIDEYITTPEYTKWKNEYTNKETHKQTMIQVEKYMKKSTMPYIEKDVLKDWLDGLKYPIYHLDFETTSQIIPELIGFRPNESWPTQYSLHIEYDDGRIEHKEYLADRLDCYTELAERLVRDIPLDSTVMAFSAGTAEIPMINGLIRHVPKLKSKLENIISNMVDLKVVFTKCMYYDPKQKGSNSIKQVMPALCPHIEDAYKKLPGVNHGNDASIVFLDMLDKKGTPEYDEIRNGLLKYCALDTLSMVEVLKVLKKSI